MRTHTRKEAGSQRPAFFLFTQKIIIKATNNKNYNKYDYLYDYLSCINISVEKIVIYVCRKI